MTTSLPGGTGSSADQVLADVAAALADDGVYVHPTLARQIDPATEASLSAALDDLPEPTYVVAFPFARNDQFGGSPADLLTRLQAREETPGLFLTTTTSYTVDEYSEVRLDAFEWSGALDVQEWYEVGGAVSSRDPADVGESFEVAVELVGGGREAVADAYQDYTDELYSDSDRDGDTGTTTSDRPSGGGEGTDLTGVLIAALLVTVLALVVAIRLRRRPGRATAPVAAKRDPVAVLPASALDRIREAHDRRLDERARTELLTLGEQLDGTEIAPRHERTSWQAALDHYDAARGLLDRPGRDRDELDVLHVVGALVLLDRGRDAFAAATRGRGFEPAAPCFLNPLHGRASAARSVEVAGRPVEVSLCQACRTDLRRNRTPDILDVRHAGEPAHWFDTGVEPWTSTGYGALDPDLVTALQRTPGRGAGPAT